MTSSSKEETWMEWQWSSVERESSEGEKGDWMLQLLQMEESAALAARPLYFPYEEEIVDDDEMHDQKRNDDDEDDDERKRKNQMNHDVEEGEDYCHPLWHPWLKQNWMSRWVRERLELERTYPNLREAKHRGRVWIVLISGKNLSGELVLQYSQFYRNDEYGNGLTDSVSRALQWGVYRRVNLRRYRLEYRSYQKYNGNFRANTNNETKNHLSNWTTIFKTKKMPAHDFILR